MVDTLEANRDGRRQICLYPTDAPRELREGALCVASQIWRQPS